MYIYILLHCSSITLLSIALALSGTLGTACLVFAVFIKNVLLIRTTRYLLYSYTAYYKCTFIYASYIMYCILALNDIHLSILYISYTYMHIYVFRAQAEDIACALQLSNCCCCNVSTYYVFYDI